MSESSNITRTTTTGSARTNSSSENGIEINISFGNNDEASSKNCSKYSNSNYLEISSEKKIRSKLSKRDDPYDEDIKLKLFCRRGHETCQNEKSDSIKNTSNSFSSQIFENDSSVEVNTSQITRESSAASSNDGQYRPIFCGKSSQLKKPFSPNEDSSYETYSSSEYLNCETEPANVPPAGPDTILVLLQNEIQTCINNRLEDLKCQMNQLIQNSVQQQQPIASSRSNSQDKHIIVKSKCKSSNNFNQKKQKQNEKLKREKFPYYPFGIIKINPKKCHSRINGPTKCDDFKRE